MGCDYANTIMMKYMDSILTSGEENALNDHLDVCVACKEDYMMYKQLTKQFEEECLFEAPIDLEECVMKKIAEITPSYYVAFFAPELATGITLGIFSIIIGISVTMSMFSAEIMAFVAGYPALHSMYKGVVLTLRSAINLFNNFCQELAVLLNNLGSMIDSAQYAILAIVGALIVAQYAVRPKASGSMGETVL